MGLVEYLRVLFGDQRLTLVEEPAFRFMLEDYLGPEDEIESE